MSGGPPLPANGPMHAWFGLTYANYLVLPRSLIQLMPVEWQERLVAILEEFHENFDLSKSPGRGTYLVQTRGDGGKFVEDGLGAYRYPDVALIERIRQSRGARR